MSKRTHLPKILFIAFCLLAQTHVFAQGDGPRSYLLLPKDLWGLNVRWMGMNQNINATGTILIPKAEVNINVFPITAFHTFSLAKRMAQVSVMVNPGSVSGSALNVPPVVPLPTTKISANGLSDGFVAFKLGLIGAPALDALTYSKKPMEFSAFADLRYWYSGSYDASKPLNLGTNRPSYHIGLPMAIPLNQNLKRATWLEVSPSVFFFGDNKEPARGTNADLIEQKAIFSLESHLSHNFNPKLWAFVNLLYRGGGQTISDGVPNDNKQNILGGGAGLGYQIMPFLSVYADYGTILAGGATDAESDMFRVAVNFSYLDLKKLKANLQK